jgi:uncharacterized PurR-regulated membrane protein YhhQ (DUF165 family)
VRGGRRLAAAALCAALVGSIALANWLTSHYGLVPAGFGLMVTAGTYAAGLSLGLRDALHEAGGYRWVLAAIAAGIGLSVILGDGRIALASAVAFGVAELTDLAVYVPLRRRNCTLAALDGIADVRVTGRFHTAGLEVTVEAA